MNSKPLAGIKVIDMTHVLTGPYCTQMLVNLGAEVIKVEAPNAGDHSRRFAPFYNGKSLYFEMINGGKKSVVLNLKDAGDLDVLKQLIAKADILVENFRPGVMAKFGLGYETLHKEFPRLVYASISGFGQTGPDALKPAYDILAQARGGIMSLTGQPDGDPTLVGVSLTDLLGGIFTAQAISTALYQREKTGEGQLLDVALLDCEIAMLECSMMRYQATKQAPKRVGNRHPSEAPFQEFRSADRPFVIAAIAGDEMFVRLCTVIGTPELAQDPRFATTEARHDFVDELGAALQKVFVEKPAAEWIKLLEAAAIPVALVQDLAEVAHDPQVLARNMLIDSEDPSLAGVQFMGLPIKMSSFADEKPVHQKAPTLGEHTESVLAEWGIKRKS